VPQLAECERILQQVGDAPDRRDLNERSRTLQAQREAAQAAEDYETVASLGEALKALQRESAYLPLSEEDYLALPARHAELVQRVTDVCKDLAASAEYEKLQALAKKRDELKVPDALSVLNTVASGTHGCNSVSFPSVQHVPFPHNFVVVRRHRITRPESRSPCRGASAGYRGAPQR
jgi:hypothetical protein